MIEDVIFTLSDKFSESDFDLGFEESSQKFIIFTNDWELYMKSTKFKNILKILRIKHKDVKFFCAYKKTLYDN